MDNKPVIASALANIPHLAAFAKIIKERFEEIEIEAVLVYLVDLVDASALDTLAAQFDILGIKGYAVAQTEAQKRAVIKSAIELHRYKGTPWAIEQALSKVGYNVTSIIERLGTARYWNGVHLFNGAINFSGYAGHWTRFRVNLDPTQLLALSPQELALIIAIINEYKNTRSHLETVGMAFPPILDSIASDITDSIALNVHVAPIVERIGHYWDGAFRFDGSIYFDSGIRDEVNTNITVGAWTPAQIADLQLWLRPEALSYIWEASSFTGTATNGSATVTASGGSGSWHIGNLVSFDGGTTFYRLTGVSGTTLTLSAPFAGASGSYAIHWAKVSAWTDSGPFGRTVSAPTNLRPYYETQVLNGYPGTYMSSAQYWSVSPITATNLLACQMVAVIRHNSMASSNVLFAHRSTANALVQFSGSGNGVQGQIRDSAGGTVQSTTNTAGSTAGFNLVSFQFAQKASPSNDYVDVWNNGNVASKTTAQANFSGNFNSTVQLIGAFNNGTVNLGYAGEIVEMVFITDEPLIEVQKVEGYLAHKYNLAANLPISHPYKNAAP